MMSEYTFWSFKFCLTKLTSTQGKISKERNSYLNNYLLPLRKVFSKAAQKKDFILENIILENIALDPLLIKFPQLLLCRD